MRTILRVYNRDQYTAVTNQNATCINSNNRQFTEQFSETQSTLQLKKDM